MHLHGDTFLDGNVSVQYPCSYGGEPLVIYSMPVHNMTPISSLVPIYPIYVKNGYNAENLTIDSASQNPAISQDDLIVVNYNPGVNAVHFGLSRTDQAPFYVNTLNFAAIDATATSHFVSSFQININGVNAITTVTPNTMPNSIEDAGMLIEKAVTSVQGAQYSWDQRRPWESYNNLTEYPIPYDFTPEAMGSAGQYAGFGFWICGQDNSSAPTVAGVKLGQIYQDRRPQSGSASL